MYPLADGATGVGQAAAGRQLCRNHPSTTSATHLHNAGALSSLSSARPAQHKHHVELLTGGSHGRTEETLDPVHKQSGRQHTTVKQSMASYQSSSQNRVSGGHSRVRRS